MSVHLDVILINLTKRGVSATGKITMDLRQYEAQKMSKYEIDHCSVSLLRQGFSSVDCPNNLLVLGSCPPEFLRYQ